MFCTSKVVLATMLFAAAAAVEVWREMPADADGNVLYCQWNGYMYLRPEERVTIEELQEIVKRNGEGSVEIEHAVRLPTGWKCLVKKPDFFFGKMIYVKNGKDVEFGRPDA